MHTWRGCWLRPTKRRNCWGTWRTIIGQECTCARQKWRCSKGGWRRHKKGERGLIPYISWPRHHWRTKALNNSASAQIPKNFEHFGQILVFPGIYRFFPINGSHPPRDPTSWQLHFAKTQHFQICHEKLHMLINGLEILWSFGPPESQKTSKIWLSATFLSCRKKSWEIAILEGQMTTKFRNSSWVGK